MVNDNHFLIFPRSRYFRFILLAGFVVLFQLTAYSKEISLSLHPARASAARMLLSGKARPHSVRQFEALLTPHFRNIAKRDFSRPAAYRPTQEDYFALTKVWSQLSPGFKALYLASVQAPDGSLRYVSPGGNIAVYYSIDGPGAVDTTDNYGYRASNWRLRMSGHNGIPDYVDEVAWAFDSAWSLEIDKLGFIRPQGTESVDAAQGKYSVFITLMASDIYGITQPGPNIANRQLGFSSYINIRNEWNGSTWQSLGYDQHPEKGIRVTAAHEFMHSIQYAMIRQQNDWNELDDFPYSWTEGCAVLMEELCFDEINDYLQYSGFYFDNPAVPLLNDSLTNIYRNYEYEHILLTKYLYQFSAPKPGIDFIKSIYFRNYRQPIDFHDNLDLTSDSLGHTWPRLLCDFHTGSFFSGARFDSRYFIEDAALFDAWTYPTDTLNREYSIVKPIGPFGMNTFDFKHEQAHSNILLVRFCGKNAGGAASSPDRWAASIILMPNDSSRQNSVAIIPIGSGSEAVASITGWSGYREALVVATNAHITEKRTGTVSFLPCEISHLAGSTARYSTASGPSDSVFCALSFTPKEDLRCSLLVNSAELSSVQSKARTAQNLAAAGPVYDIFFPPSWFTSIDSMVCVFTMLTTNAQALLTKLHMAGSNLMVASWNDEKEYWDTLPTFYSTSGQYSQWKTRLRSTGTHALFAPGSAQTAYVYPNPVHASQTLTIQAVNLRSVSVYRMDGQPLFSTKRDLLNEGPPPLPWRQYGDSTWSVTWDLRNPRNKPVVSGTYLARIEYGNGSRPAARMCKIMVLPGN
jgi:hypothetical protein